MTRTDKRRQHFIRLMIEAGSPEEELQAYRTAYPGIKSDKSVMTSSGRLLKIMEIADAINKGKREREEEMNEIRKQERIRIAVAQVAHETEIDAKLSQIAMGTYRRKRKVPAYNRKTKVFEIISIEEEPSETDIIAASDKLYRRKGSYAVTKTDITSGGEKIKANTPINLTKVPLETLLELAKHINDTENKG
ncbi:MAG: hypothetical protein ABIT05_01325 [Chitinophagaceae bacterium]